MVLRLADGTTIGDLVRPPQGMRHRVLFGVDESSGREVAAKVELIPGALERERRALEWLTSQGGPAPRLLAAAPLVESEENPGALCLVTERVAGAAPTSTAGWERLGAALARLGRVPWEGSGLPALDHDAFLRLHERRVGELAAGARARPRRGAPGGPARLRGLAAGARPRRSGPRQLPRRRRRRDDRRLGGRGGRAPRPRPRAGPLHRAPRRRPRGLRRRRARGAGRRGHRRLPRRGRRSGARRRRAQPGGSPSPGSSSPTAASSAPASRACCPGSTRSRCSRRRWVPAPQAAARPSPPAEGPPGVRERRPCRSRAPRGRPSRSGSGPRARTRRRPRCSRRWSPSRPVAFPRCSRDVRMPAATRLPSVRHHRGVGRRPFRPRPRGVGGPSVRLRRRIRASLRRAILRRHSA